MDFGAYLRDLCTGVAEALVHDERVEVVVEAEAISTIGRHGRPAGHGGQRARHKRHEVYAYPPPDKGLILVRLVAEVDGFRLSVADSGRGLPERAESPPGGGLGMKLVKSLVAQVNGELSMTGPPGSAFEIKVAAP